LENGEDPKIFQLFNEIGIIDQLTRARLERSLPDGLKISQFGVLNHFVRLGGHWSPNRLAKAFQVTKAAMTNTLQRLEHRGLIEIQPDPNDGRAKIVEITEAGRQMRMRCLEKMSPMIKEMSDILSGHDLDIALPILTNIRKYLDENR